MKLFSAIVVVVLVGGSHSRMVLEDGKEYVYDTFMAASSGTMDYASAGSGFAYKTKTRIQVSGRTMNIQFADMKVSQYNGMTEPGTWPWDETVFTPVPHDSDSVISITTNEDGLFESLQVSSDSNVFARNMGRAWAAQLQINTKNIKAGKTAFKSKEQLLQGNCDVTYTVSPQAVTKTVSHVDDCENRVYRIVDDYRGFKCNRDTSAMGYPSSLATTVFLYEQSGDVYNVKRIVWSSSFIAQFFSEAGSSFIVYTNATSDLVDVKASSGDLAVSGSSETITDLSYEFADNEYKWNVDRDLKASEPLFTTGKIFEEDGATLKEAIKKGLAYQRKIIQTLSEDENTLQKAHQYGINNIMPAFLSMDYDSLKSLAEELLADKSDTGVMMSNVFGELLGSTGTTAAAMVIRDLVMENKFDNDRDSARILTGVPFHIRRPNTQLVKEFEKLFEIKDGDRRFVKMAIPLVMGHLVRMTCERAGTPMSPEQIKCFKEFASTYVEKAANMYKGADREEKAAILAGLSNMRFGGIANKLKPLIYGKVEEEDHLRAAALWAAGYDAIITQGGPDYFLPLFADRSQPHELRIGALELMMWGNPTAAQMSTIVAVLFKERDYEVLNYAFALMERWAASINPCNRKTSRMAKYFLKYMKQYSNYETDTGFGVSKTYSREFQKEKYGYGGGMSFYVIGSHKSTTPLTIGMGITNNMLDGNYRAELISVHLRIEGLAKALVKKFKTIDPNTWKTADLSQILSGEMGIRERPDQPVRVEVTILLKGTIIFRRNYDEGDASKEGKIGTFLDNLKDLGDTYTINHQRAVQAGAFLYEQPTNIGLPMAIMSTVTTLGSVKATVKRGNHRGLLYRDVNYDIDMLTQSVRGAMVFNPWRKAAYAIFNDRLYRVAIPRKFVIGVNPLKKELKLSIARPSVDKPYKIFMHSQTSVLIRGGNLRGNYESLQQNCKNCQARIVITKGEDHVKERVFYDRNSERFGYKAFGKYFRCEMNINRGNTVGRLIGAFMPYNKNPRNLYTSIVMGIRQIRAFLLYYPRIEQCGALFQYSQSDVNPVNEIEISVRANMEENGSRLFFNGRKWFIMARIKAKGEPEDREIKINLAYQFTPGYLENNFKLQISRMPVASLDIEPYTLCFALENKFPPFTTEFLDYDKDSDMKVNGKALLQYGKVTSCSDAEGEIRVNFEHSTTQEAREELKNKWYYQQCMDLKNTPEWSGREELPVSEACYMTVWDATSARKYTWDVKFVKLTKRVQSLISKVKTAVQAGLLPYWDIDPDEVDDVDGEVGPFMKIAATFKNNEKNVDIQLETRRGTEEFNDVPLRLNWSKRLRNLKFTSTIKRLMTAKIINPCLVTTGTIRTNDNVTIPYEPSSCWTLASATCGPSPVYAVFSKKDGSGLSAKVYVGGHSVDFTAGSDTIQINGDSRSIAPGEQIEHTVDAQEIFKVFRWGSTFHVYSSLKVWVAWDGNFVEVVPAPSTKGQHCGICGNYNRNKFDELTGKDDQLLSSTAEFVEDWKWKC